MKFSTRSRYGLRLMFELALFYGENPVMLKDIAKRESISEKYLSKLVIPLRLAGLILSTRGAHGGYTLAKEPDKITVLDITKSLDGEISIAKCARNGSACKRTLFCPTKDVWRSLELSVSEFLNRITLENIVQNYKAKEKKQSMYYI